MNHFQSIKSSHPVLAEHATVMSVLAILNDERPQAWQEKEAIIATIIAENQRRPDKFWGTLMVVVFYPMLSRLRHRIIGDAMAGDDLDQLVLSVFLDVFNSFPLDTKRDRFCMHLRQMTERRVFRKLRNVQNDQEQVRNPDPVEYLRLENDWANHAGMLQNEDEFPQVWPETRPTPSEPLTQNEQARLVAFLVDKVADDIDGDRLDLVISTQIYGERLSDIVRRKFPDLSTGDRKRIYQRVKRRHSRTLEKLRELLNYLHCPQTAPTDALPFRMPSAFEGGE